MLNVVELFNKAKPNLTAAASSSKASNPQTSGSNTGKATMSVAEELGLGADFYDDNHNMSTTGAVSYLNSNVYTEKGAKIETDKQNINGINCVLRTTQTITLDTDGDGTMEELTRDEAMAATFDSELDLYIKAQVDAIREKYGTRGWTGSEFVGWLSADAQAELEALGIKVDKIDNRTFVFSLVDENGNIMQDQDGKLGSCVYGDWVIPDGYSQKSENEFSSILDTMGYDCISYADFAGNKEMLDKVIAGVEERINNGMYEYSDKQVSDVYGKSGRLEGGRTSITATNLDGFSEISEEVNAETEAKLKEEIQKQALKNTHIVKEGYQKLFEARMKNKESSEEASVKEVCIEIIAKRFNIDKSQVKKIVEN